jgi:hypothetical protein
MKLIFFMIYFVTNFLLFASGQLTIARMHYDGGGDWYNDPDIVPNITKYLNETIQTKFSLEQIVVRPSDSIIFDYPFIFVTGHGNIHFSEREIQNLRNYLERGGFLYFDDDYGMDEAARREIKKLFPDKDLVELPSNHNIFHCFFSFSVGIPKIHEHDGKRPQAFAIFSGEGRIQLLYTYETNITDGWSDMHDNSPALREKAMQFGANIFYYLMTSGL